MSAHDPFFQFPICLLAQGHDCKDRLEVICSYSLVEAGRKAASGLDSDQWESTKLELAERSDLPKDYRKASRDHAIAALGAKITNVQMGAVNSSLSRWKTASDFIADFERLHGTDAQVRIRTKILFDAKDRDFQYRYFAAICAVYSCIGRKATPVLITRSAVRMRMLGYRNREIMEKELSYPS